MLRDTELERLYQLAAKAWARTARALDDWRWRRAERRVQRSLARQPKAPKAVPVQPFEKGRFYDARVARELAHHAREDLTRVARRDA